jgi:hypothetical protein
LRRSTNVIHAGSTENVGFMGRLVTSAMGGSVRRDGKRRAVRRGLVAAAHFPISPFYVLNE